MSVSKQQDETGLGDKALKRPYMTPLLSEYGNMTTLTQGNLVAGVITPLTVTLADVLLG